MSTIYNRIRDNYSIVPNRIVNDKNISLSAKMLYIYMAAKPDNWEFNMTAMEKELNISRQTIRKHINELVYLGWVTDLGQKTNNGKFGGCLFMLNDLMTQEESETVAKITQAVVTGTDIVNPINTKVKRKRNIENRDVVNAPSWKTFYDDYILIVNDAENRLASDEEYRLKYESWFTNIDYIKTVMKTSDWWRSQAGWEHCKKRKSANIDLYMSLRNNLDRNKVYKPYKEKEVIEKVKTMDEQLELFRKAREV